MSNHKISTLISTYNSVEYLKLAIKSVRQNAYYKDIPILVFAENNQDGTDEWLEEHQDKYDLEIYIEHNDETRPKGVGGGMDFLVHKAQTEFVNIIHSDMWIAPNQDLELLKLYDNIPNTERLIASSFRIQPHIFPEDPDYRPGTVFFPIEEFGDKYSNFDSDYFDKWATEFSKTNDIMVRKGGGAGFFCRKRDYEWIGGNDPLFRPVCHEDMDLFIRMQLAGFTFKMTTKSIQWHFSARPSMFTEDDYTKRAPRRVKAEDDNYYKWMKKWGKAYDTDEQTFVKPIQGSKVEPRIEKNLQPWMHPKEVELVKKYLKPTDIMMEYGSGGSTIQFGNLVDTYYSVEHVEDWYLKVWTAIEKNYLLDDTHKNVFLNHIAPNKPRSKPTQYDEFTDYIEFPKNLDNVKFDKVFIDGRARSHCAKFILDYLHEDSIVFFHDFWARPEYHWILDYYDEVESVKDTQVETGQTIVALKPKAKMGRTL